MKDEKENFIIVPCGRDGDKLASDISADGDFSNYDLTLMEAIVMGRYENGWS